MGCSIIVSKKKMNTWKQGVQCQRGNTIYFILQRSIFHEQRQDNDEDFLENFPYEMLLLASIWGGFVAKIKVFRDVLPCSLVQMYRCYWRICCLNLQDLLKIGPHCSSTAQVLQTPQGHYLNAHYHENCKSCLFI